MYHKVVAKQGEHVPSISLQDRFSNSCKCNEKRGKERLSEEKSRRRLTNQQYRTLQISGDIKLKKPHIIKLFI